MYNRVLGIRWWTVTEEILWKLLPPCESVAPRGATGNRWQRNRNGTNPRCMSMIKKLRIPRYWVKRPSHAEQDQIGRCDLTRSPGRSHSQILSKTEEGLRPVYPPIFLKIQCTLYILLQKGDF